MIDNTGKVFKPAVRPMWGGIGLTFVGILYGSLIALTALIFGASALWIRGVAALILVLIGVVVFGPLRFRFSERANRYLSNAGQAPQGRT